VQLYTGIKFVGEADFHHGDVTGSTRKWHNKAGLEFEGDRNFFVQLLYDDAQNHARLLIGAAF
jgi:hypothetical protein